MYKELFPHNLKGDSLYIINLVIIGAMSFYENNFVDDAVLTLVGMASLPLP